MNARAKAIDMMPGPRLYWIEHPFGGRLAVTARPTGGLELDNAVAGWRAANLDVVVSMLEAEEAEDLGLGLQERLCGKQGIIFLNCPVPDHGLPEDRAAFLAVADQVLEHVRAGRRAAAHCFAGIGRSPLLVATVLVRHGLDPDIAWARVSQARGIVVPDTDAQWQWLADVADGNEGACHSI